MSLTPELRKRIYDEEKFRLEVQERIREEIRLRRQSTALVTWVVLLVAFFAIGYAASNYFLKTYQTTPEVVASQQPAAAPEVDQTVLSEISRSLKPPAAGEVCARAIDRPRPQVRVTVELATDVSATAVRRAALSNVKTVGSILRKHGLAVPAYVEVFSPKRWYGLALYDSDTLKITWDPCPGKCGEQGTRYITRCRE